MLEHRAYLDGTRYYETAECFLFFASKLLLSTSDTTLHARLVPLLRTRILERAGASGDALSLAMRVLAGSVVGLRLEQDLTQLLPLQCEDGGWGPGWMYKYGSANIKIGNRGLTTALALNAISALQSSLPTPMPSPTTKFQFQFQQEYPQPKERPPLSSSTVPQQQQQQLSLQLQLRSLSRPEIGKQPVAAVTSLRLQQPIRGLALGIPSPAPSPPPLSPVSVCSTRKERTFSAGSLARDVYAYLFSTVRSKSSRRVQDVGVGVHRHRRGGSVG